MLFTEIYEGIDALAALCGFHFNGEGYADNDGAAISNFKVKEEIERLLDDDKEAAGNCDLTIDEATVLVECFAAAIEG